MTGIREQRCGGYVWCSVVRGLIIERWQTIFYDTTIILEHFVRTVGGQIKLGHLKFNLCKSNH
jgi:hypothetical protein